MGPEAFEPLALLNRTAGSSIKEVSRYAFANRYGRMAVTPYEVMPGLRVVHATLGH
jgi:hypothetical protein